jgi:hypothetical protein
MNPTINDSPARNLVALSGGGIVSQITPEKVHRFKPSSASSIAW